MPESQRVAIITGGGSGIGAAAAEIMAGRGIRIAVIGRRLGLLNETVGRIAKTGGTAIAVKADLADPAAPQAIIQRVAGEWGKIDILVNDAAYIKHVPIHEGTRVLFDEHIAVNVRAPYLLIQAALPYLKKSPGAAIINISSSSGSLAIPGQALYGLSKAALEYLTRSLAAELAPFKIRVNAIAPGPVDTPIHLSWAGDDIAGAYERMIREVPLRRMGTAVELGEWIAWLADENASFVTGAVIPVDGGQTLPGGNSRIAQE